MIEQRTSDCALGLSIETLSAWRDGDLGAAETRRIREHAATCAACRQRLAGFELVARALGRQRELEPGDRVWQAVRSRITSQTPGRSSPMRISAWNWRGAAAVASALLVVGLLGYVLASGLSQRGGTPPPTSTATVATTPTLTGSKIVPGPQLAWQPVQGYPVGATQAPVVAPGDGNVAYVCVPPAQGQTSAHLYVTRDQGRSWAPGAGIPVGAQPTGGAKPVILLCNTAVDAVNPATVVVSAQWIAEGASPDPSHNSRFVSFDYGAQWQTRDFGQSFDLGQQIASDAAGIYAVGYAQQSAGTLGLFVSHDQMQSWQQLTLPVSQPVAAFWLDPATGALLVATDGQSGADPFLLKSADGGATWAQVQVPDLGPKGRQWAAAIAQDGQTWLICAAASALSGAHGNALTCSSDGGTTWATRPGLDLGQNSPKGFQFYAPADLFGLTSDGTVLATAITTSTHVYRLLPGQSAWQDLGPQPDTNNPSPGYAPTTAGGAFWYVGNTVYTAAYPSS